MATKPNNKTTSQQTIQEPKEDKKITVKAAIAPLKSPNVIKQIDKKYYDKLDQNEIEKQDIIKDYAGELETEGKMPLDKICNHICDELTDVVSESYVRKILTDEKYKNQSMVTNAKKRVGNTSSASSKKPKNEETATAMEEPKPDPKPETNDDDEPETHGRENTKRENAVNFENYFKLVDNSKEYAINSKKLGNVPTDVKDKMITQLIGGMEHIQGELEQSLKQVENLRKELKQVTQQRDHFSKTIDEHITLEKEKDTKIAILEKTIKLVKAKK